jgi:hypothetical protein
MSGVAHCSKCGTPANQGARFCPACGTPITGGPPPLPVKQAKTTGNWKIAGIVVLACLAGLLLMAVNFKLFLRLMAIGGTALFMLSIAVMFLTFRNSRRISPAGLAISMATSLITLFVYSFFLGFHLASLMKILAMLCGTTIGVGWALTTPARLNNGIVERTGNFWYLVVWAVIFVINQLITILTGKPPHIAMILLMFGTGTVIGNSITLITMFYKIKAETVKIEK